jgi:succinyl-CoA synthetase beta subunit
MKLIESDGKRILTSAGISVPEGLFLAFDADVSSIPSSLIVPCYVKSQVLEGRRGKRGLVKKCETPDDVRDAIHELRGLLNASQCAGFLCESAVPHAEEWLVSADIDSVNGKIRLNFSAQGGMGVAQASSVLADSASEIGAFNATPAIREVLAHLFDAIRKEDALSIEINPLAIKEDGSCVALDAKVELDDAAAFRHPERAEYRTLPEGGRPPSERERAYAAVLEESGHRGTLGRYVDLEGDIALILSGGGASLVAIDALKLAGGRPANYVEMSGNPDPEMVRKACRVVLSKPGIKAVWIAGSFANFTDIQATVNGVLAAMADLEMRVPVVIRRDGPNAGAAKLDAEQWAKDHGVTLQFHRADTDLDASAHAVVELMKKV